MGTYLFERHRGDGIGADATRSLNADVETALRQIDWVDTWELRDDDVDDDLCVVDISFEEDWQELRAVYPDQVRTVLTRYGLRLLANPTLTGRPSEASDPLAGGVADGEPIELDDEPLDGFEFDE